jgi:hypothetical protein
VKHVDTFRDFLKDTVNLNQGRIDQLDTNVEALKSYLRGSNWVPRIRGFEEQGSWVHETIIKPVDGDEFDADLLVLVRPVDGWAAADYVSSLAKVFESSGVYKEKAKTSDYCVTIVYAGDNRVDIAPCVVSRLWEGSLEVCNRRDNRFDRTEPIEYTKWIRPCGRI